ncbi:MAG: class I SAM-dependent methyltransferase [Actinobacteria bacterium]|nr:class I SAM-dependent methyltransferase [Actinomycetota bacterium]
MIRRGPAGRTITRVTDAVTARARAVLEAAAASGLALDVLPGSTAKIRLMLDLAGLLRQAERPLRVLDVGAGGRNNPFNLWEPFLPLCDRIELVGADVAHLDPTRRRASELGFPVELREASADGLMAAFDAGSFDVVVSTQVLEHLPRWQDALREMRDVLRPGGRLLVTCDSGDLALGAGASARLGGKRAYARVAARLPTVRAALDRVVSGEWEQGPSLDRARDALSALGLRTLALRHYGLRDLKDVQPLADGAARLLSLAVEEALAPGATGLFKLLYLSAERPPA